MSMMVSMEEISIFISKSANWEAKYPFGSKESQEQFTYTGIDLQQHPDNSIELSQSKYIRNINPITLNFRNAEPMKMPWGN